MRYDAEELKKRVAAIAEKAGIDLPEASEKELVRAMEMVK